MLCPSALALFSLCSSTPVLFPPTDEICFSHISVFALRQIIFENTLLCYYNVRMSKICKHKRWIALYNELERECLGRCCRISLVVEKVIYTISDNLFIIYLRRFYINSDQFYLLFKIPSCICSSINKKWCVNLNSVR